MIRKVHNKHNYMKRTALARLKVIAFPFSACETVDEKSCSLASFIFETRFYSEQVIQLSVRRHSYIPESVDRNVKNMTLPFEMIVTLFMQICDTLLKV